MARWSAWGDGGSSAAWPRDDGRAACRYQGGMISYLRAFVPRSTPVSLAERLRSAVGAFVGLLLTGLVCRLAVGTGSALPILMAPMGASAVLLFAVPASPLAQPWSIIGGNAIAALVGVCAAGVIHDPFAAAAAAVGVAIALMMTCRCVHPPSGAVALTAVLGGPAVRELGFGFVLWPVGANSLLLLGVALLFNTVVGRSYPHRPIDAVQHHTKDPAPSARIGFTADDLDTVLQSYDQLLDIDRDDLEAILRQAEIRSLRRRSGLMTCAAVMSRDIVSITPGGPDQRGPRSAALPSHQGASGHRRADPRRRDRHADGSARQGRLGSSRAPPAVAAEIGRHPPAETRSERQRCGHHDGAGQHDDA